MNKTSNAIDIIDSPNFPTFNPALAFADGEKVLSVPLIEFKTI